MADNKKYYYLKLKDNFFDTDEMIILESMPDGYLYSNILLKLYLRSLKYDGRLMFNERIPFNSTMLAQVTRHSVGVIEKAMQVFQELNLVEVLDNGAIYISDIQNFIGSSSTEADRKREYRAKIETEKYTKSIEDGTNVQQMSDKTPPEIEKEIEKKIEKKVTKDTINYTEVVNMYNEICISLPSVRLPLSDKRKKSIKARLNKYSLDDIKLAFEKTQDSDFLKGCNNRNWTANFDWVMNDTNIAKILDGNYDNRKENNNANKRNFSQNDENDRGGCEEKPTKKVGYFI